MENASPRRDHKYGFARYVRGQEGVQSLGHDVEPSVALRPTRQSCAFASLEPRKCWCVYAQDHQLKKQNGTLLTENARWQNISKARHSQWTDEHDTGHAVLSLRFGLILRQFVFASSAQMPTALG